MFSLKDITTISLTLFAIIDIIGSLPIIISIKNRQKHLDSGKATIAAGSLMIVFLFIGEQFLGLFGVDLQSFAIAGSIVIFIIGLEMILGIEILKNDPNAKSGSIIPIAFPIIAGSGTLTTIISMRAVYSIPNILIGIILNLIFAFCVMQSAGFIERKLGESGLSLVRKFFGIVLLSIAVRIFKSNF
ncbi:MAG: MarC family protein [Sphingobacteriales bacterium]|jgi:multiple antibiotic resistance protein|nr:MarC family protein [Sphingobacteriales bacterium]